MLLDLGCGGGAFVPVVTELGWSVIGVDVSAEQLRVARKRVRALAAELVQADATDRPFGEASFDAVLTHAVTRDGVLMIGDGYRERSRQLDLPAFKPERVRARVGATHVPLEDLLGAVIQSELELERVLERPQQDTRLLLALRARRPSR